MSDEILLADAPCGYLTTTPDGTITATNQTFLAWTGYAREELVGRRTFASLLTAGGRIYHETHYAPMLLMQGSAREIALDLVCADGRRLPALVNSVLDRDAQGAPAAVRTAVFDATERREYERELLRAKERAESAEVQARLLAATLQQTLMPPTPPHIEGLEVQAAYRPAGTGAEIGGDFYDVFELGPDQWVVALGDVEGKGVEAAIVTALVRYTIRAAAVRVRRVAEILDNVDAVLRRHESHRFCTVVMVRLVRHDGTWTATIGSGGHPLPLLARAGRSPEFVGAPGTLLGFLDTATFTDRDVELGPGDALVLYTDGVTEARGTTEFYGDARLRACVARHAASPGDLAHHVVADVLEFQPGDPRDDIAVVAVRVPVDP